jgi:hypothetical protein
MPNGRCAPADELRLVAMEGSKDVGTELQLTGVITRSPHGGLRMTVGTPEENGTSLSSLDKAQLAPQPAGAAHASVVPTVHINGLGDSHR